MEDHASMFNILLQLEYKDLINLCSLNININKICNDQHFWKIKYLQDYLEKPFFNNWKSSYEYMYLLNLNYDILIKLNNSLINDTFWEIKYHKDFALGDIIKEVTDVNWQELYRYANRVNKVYPSLKYEFTETDLSTLFDDTTIYKSSDYMDFIDELIDMVEADNWGSAILKNNHTVPLYNFYHSLEASQDNYEQGIGKLLSGSMDKVLATLNINDALIIYMFGSNSWGVILTRSQNEYNMKLYKSYEGPF